jgi:hypothetical protein
LHLAAWQLYTASAGRNGKPYAIGFAIALPMNWVEKGRAPEQVIATGSSMPGESRPLCPHPAHPHYNGSGDAKSAASYSCR